QGSGQAVGHRVRHALVRLHPGADLLRLVRDHALARTRAVEEGPDVVLAASGPSVRQRRYAARSGMAATKSGRGGMTFVSRLGVYPGGYDPGTTLASSRSIGDPFTAGPIGPSLAGSTL